MSNDMLGQIVRKLVQLPAVMLGMLCDLLEKLSGPNGQVWSGELGRFLRRENPFSISSIQEEWAEFYRKYFRISVDFSGVSIPEETEDFSRVLFIPSGLTINQVIKAMKKCFNVWTYTDDLDQDVTENDRNTQASYAIRVRDRVEADEELKSTSAKDLREKNISCLTLLERLVYELKYWSETNEHLDVQNYALCAGSRYRHGGVPRVYWLGDELCVYWSYTGHASDRLRGRVAVS